eukprot:474833-Prymnesium_polylepis.1
MTWTGSVSRQQDAEEHGALGHLVAVAGQPRVRHVVRRIGEPDAALDELVLVRAGVRGVFGVIDDVLQEVLQLPRRARQLGD